MNTMKQSIRAGFTAVAMILGAVAHANAGDIYVIANSGLAMGAADIKAVFTGDKQFIGPVKLSPVDNSAAQGEFVTKALKLEDAAKYNTIWTKKSFRDGVTIPAVKLNDEQVIEFVKSTPGGVGYVSTKPAGVTVVEKF